MERGSSYSPDPMIRGPVRQPTNFAWHLEKPPVSKVVPVSGVIANISPKESDNEHRQDKHPAAA